MESFRNSLQGSINGFVTNLLFLSYHSNSQAKITQRLISVVIRTPAQLPILRHWTHPMSGRLSPVTASQQALLCKRKQKPRERMSIICISFLDFSSSYGKKIWEPVMVFQCLRRPQFSNVSIHVHPSVCRSQRTTYGSWFFISAMWFQGWNSHHQAGWQEPLLLNPFISFFSM